jgi:hypothetical protein
LSASRQPQRLSFIALHRLGLSPVLVSHWIIRKQVPERLIRKTALGRCRPVPDQETPKERAAREGRN